MTELAQRHASYSLADADTCIRTRRSARQARVEEGEDEPYDTECDTPAITMQGTRRVPAARTGWTEPSYSAFRNAIDGMKKYSPPFIVTVCGAGLATLDCGLSHFSGQAGLWRVPWPMT